MQFQCHSKDCVTVKTIRIFNVHEVGIENSVTKVTVIPSDGIFNSNRTTITDSFFLHILLSTIAFRLQYVLFYQFYAKILNMFALASLLYVDIEKVGGNLM